MARSRQPLSTNVRERILDAASAEFAAHGKRGASVRAIGARAEVTAAMINYYFGGKQALYDQVVARAQAQLYQMVAGALASGERDEMPQRLALAYFDYLCQEKDLPRLLLREVLDHADVSALASQYVEPLRALFRQHFGADDEAFQTAVSIFGAVVGYFIYAPVLGELLDEDPLGAEAIAARRKHIEKLASWISSANN